MEPLLPPKTLNIYALVRQNGMTFSYVVPTVINTGTTNIGSGFFLSKQEAEHNRTLEVLKEQSTNVIFHVFEMTIPNPAYKE
jgi:hypothetical protein